ncbi:Uncharacterised protein [Klebsiella pneumoniae]|nr:Uncharacterised protein [Klebsiella pneumoniae]
MLCRVAATPYPAYGSWLCRVAAAPYPAYGLWFCLVAAAPYPAYGSWLCRVAAAPYPAYGLWLLPGGGCALPGLRFVAFAGWRLRLTRPTVCGFVGPVSAAPPGDITEAGAWRSAFHTRNRALSLLPFSDAVQASASLFFQTPAAHRTAHSTVRP